MLTILTIILLVLIAFNVWLSYYTIKREKERRRLLQDRMDECDMRLGEVMNELGKAKQRLIEANSSKAALKKSFNETIAEYEKLTRDYRRLQDDLDASMQHQEPVDAGQPKENTQPGEAANKPLKPLKTKKTAKSKKAKK